MPNQFSRREVLKLAAISSLASLPTPPVQASQRLFGPTPGWIAGPMSGAAALTEALHLEGCTVVFGIPGAQENELWDTFKARHMPYHLVTHEFSAAAGADGYARSTGRPGVLCVVPGPGVTNSLTVLGEALLDSIPLVCIVGDVACGDKYRPFQIHSLPNIGLLQNVCKEVMAVRSVDAIPMAVRHAFRCARAGEPGPVAVVIPYNLLTAAHHYNCGPIEPAAIPVDDGGFQRALPLLADQQAADRHLRRSRLHGLFGFLSAGGRDAAGSGRHQHVGQGRHTGGSSAFGWLGLRSAGNCAPPSRCSRTSMWYWRSASSFSEVSTGFYGLPQHRHLIHVDINPENLGRSHAHRGLHQRGRRLFPEPTAPMRRPSSRRPLQSAAAGLHPGTQDLRFPQARRASAPAAAAIPWPFYSPCAAAPPERDGLPGCHRVAVLGRRGFHRHRPADVVHPDRQSGDGLVDRRRPRRSAPPSRAGRR